MSIICPFCDSHNIETIAAVDQYQLPFCGTVAIPHNVHRCLDCEEEGDFDNTLDKNLTKAIDKANLDSAPQLMDDLTQNGITMTYLEKALRLPFRTTARWKRGRLCHSSLALLRVIRFSPALLQAADDNFSQAAMARYQITRTWDFFKFNTKNPELKVTTGLHKIQITYSGSIAPMAISSTNPQVRLESA